MEKYMNLEENWKFMMYDKIWFMMKFMIEIMVYHKTSTNILDSLQHMCNSEDIFIGWYTFIAHMMPQHITKTITQKKDDT